MYEITLKNLIAPDSGFTRLLTMQDPLGFQTIRWPERSNLTMNMGPTISESLNSRCHFYKLNGKIKCPTCTAWLKIRLQRWSSSNIVLKWQMPWKRQCHHLTIRHCWNNLWVQPRRQCHSLLKSICNWESAHHTLPQLWSPVNLMKNKCWLESVTVNDPLTNSVWCNV